MRNNPLLAVICSVFLLGTAPAAKAANPDLDFSLGNSRPAIAAVENQPLAQLPISRPAVTPESIGPAIAQAETRLPVALAERSGGPAESVPPENFKLESNGLAETTTPTERAVPPGSVASGNSGSTASTPVIATLTPPMPAPPPNADRGVVLDFDLKTSAKIATPSQPAASSPDAQPDQVTPQKSEAVTVAIAAQPLPANPDALFAGGAESIVARTVGHAEGTRTADGQKTDAYYGHVDPGNAHWNLGSFSYQHCDQACTPEIADDRQLAQLKRQAEVIQQRAAANHLTLTLEEVLNGIDLANQAPLAALEQGGYVDWLKAARQRGLTGSDAVLWARTWSFLNPQTQTWDAPGLGNQYESISHDQDRRLSAIARALANYHAQRL